MMSELMKASYDPESNVATSTYDVSHQLNDRLWPATNVTVSAASLYEVFVEFDADGGAEVASKFFIILRIRTNGRPFQ